MLNYSDLGIPYFTITYACYDKLIEAEFSSLLQAACRDLAIEYFDEKRLPKSHEFNAIQRFGFVNQYLPSNCFSGFPFFRSAIFFKRND